MRPVMNKIVNASALLGIHTAMGYAYGAMAKLQPKQVALAWFIWETADIAIQCLSDAILKEKSSSFKMVALPISDVVGLVALAQAGLMGSPLMRAALIVCTVIARASSILSNFTCECCAPGPRFTMDVVGYKRPESVFD